MKSENEVIDRLIDFLIGRRVIQQVLWRENIAGIEPSMRDIKQQLVTALSDLGMNSPCSPHIRSMIKATNQLLDVCHMDLNMREQEESLIQMRVTFQIELNQLISILHLDIPQDVMNVIRSMSMS